MVVLLQLCAWICAVGGIGWAAALFPFTPGEAEKMDRKVECLNGNIDRIDLNLPQIDCDALVASLTPVFPDSYILSMMCLAVGVLAGLLLGGLGSVLQTLREIKVLAATPVEALPAAPEAPAPAAPAPNAPAPSAPASSERKEPTLES